MTAYKKEGDVSDSTTDIVRTETSRKNDTPTLANTTDESIAQKQKNASEKSLHLVIRKSLADEVQRRWEVPTILCKGNPHHDELGRQSSGWGELAESNNRVVAVDDDGHYLLTGFAYNKTATTAKDAIDAVTAKYGYTPDFLGIYNQVGASAADATKSLASDEKKASRIDRNCKQTTKPAKAGFAQHLSCHRITLWILS